MSSSEEEFDLSDVNSDDLELSTSPEYEIEQENDGAFASPSTSEDEDAAAAFSEEPLADAEWTAEYERERKADEEMAKSLKDRLDGTVSVNEWCECGNCNCALLQNISECYCCKELEDCGESLGSDLVQQDVSPNTSLKCITDHPGFQPVCLQKWSLRMAAGKYRTKGKEQYRQRGSEERFLRSVSYREFTRLVYGRMGNKRIPLPACAYSAIRKQFPVNKDENFAGFDLDED